MNEYNFILFRNGCANRVSFCQLACCSSSTHPHLPPLPSLLLSSSTPSAWWTETSPSLDIASTSPWLPMLLATATSPSGMSKVRGRGGQGSWSTVSNRKDGKVMHSLASNSLHFCAMKGNLKVHSTVLHMINKKNTTIHTVS